MLHAVTAQYIGARGFFAAAKPSVTLYFVNCSSPLCTSRWSMIVRYANRSFSKILHFVLLDDYISVFSTSWLSLEFPAKYNLVLTVLMRLVASIALESRVVRVK